MKEIWSCRARRALSNEQRPVAIGAIVSEKKIFSLKSYNSAPIGQIWMKRIWFCRARRALSSEQSPVALGAIVPEKKIIWMKDICSCRARRALSNDHSPVALGAIVPEKKINSYNLAPSGQILIKKYGRVGREEPFPMTAVRFS
ncbi:hypothetical protein V1477_017800 [Vespula maculifrons]|uniref:Uncharacterized protein n=1 Tax=Vespula maculifrons TaxID=7453 RepID=A0ABD2B0J5_VESMC